jgi:lysophospholipase L1-like esterase
VLLGAVSALLSTGAIVPAGANAAMRLAAAKPAYYLALGDSVPVANGTQAYPYRILAHYQRTLRGLNLNDMAIAGATTGAMLNGGQYQAALQFLKAHRGHMALITIDIGGDDVAPCFGATGIDQGCETQARATIKSNLSTMLAGLRAAAPHVPLIGMTYYNPFLGYWLAGGFFRSFALATVPGGVALNRELTTLYGGTKNTADVQGTFKATDLTTTVSSQWGMVPIAVKRACSWLDIVCHAGAPETFGLDPNPTGEAKIAAAFEQKIGALPAPRSR